MSRKFETLQKCTLNEDDDNVTILRRVMNGYRGENSLPKKFVVFIVP